MDKVDSEVRTLLIELVSQASTEQCILLLALLEHPLVFEALRRFVDALAGEEGLRNLW